ncbi:hypothetical protein [Ureibacillus acetophenoni]|nr:hypothetical protein [Ureibacillus acetophenoni]
MKSKIESIATGTVIITAIIGLILISIYTFHFVSGRLLDSIKMLVRLF